VEIAVNKAGKVFWGTTPIDNDALVAKLKTISAMNPQPDVHIRGDQGTSFEFIGRVINDCERAGIAKLGFITEPPARNAG
jgi:biopolymer transport protein ExbD